MPRPSLVNVFGAVAMASLCVLAVGCTRENPGTHPVGGYPTPDPNAQTPCLSNDDCSAGQICTTAGCRPQCQQDADCAAGQTCKQGSPNFCAPKDPVVKPVDPNNPTWPQKPGGTVTVPPKYCLGDAECGNGRVCVYGKCETACSDTSCGAGKVCVAGRCYADNASACGMTGLTLCRSSEECGSGRSCVKGACYAACTQSGQCGIGQVCVSGTCVTDAKPVTAQCTFDTDCGLAFRCINAYCHPLCASDDQCGANNFCDHGVCRANTRPAG